MRRPNLKTHILTLVVIAANVAGNFAMKWGLEKRAEPLGATLLGYLWAMFEPAVAAGIVLLIVWLLTRMALLSRADLSYVLPVTSIGYALNAFAARLFLGERMSAARWIGTLLIMAGTMLVGSTVERTHEEKAVAVEARQ